MSAWGNIAGEKLDEKRLELAREGKLSFDKLTDEERAALAQDLTDRNPGTSGHLFDIRDFIDGDRSPEFQKFYLMGSKELKRIALKAIMKHPDLKNLTKDGREGRPTSEESSALTGCILAFLVGFCEELGAGPYAGPHKEVINNNAASTSSMATEAIYAGWRRTRLKRMIAEEIGSDDEDAVWDYVSDEANFKTVKKMLNELKLD